MKYHPERDDEAFRNFANAPKNDKQADGCKELLFYIANYVSVALKLGAQ
jgi:hypothetical protein